MKVSVYAFRLRTSGSPRARSFAESLVTTPQREEVFHQQRRLLRARLDGDILKAVLLTTKPNRELLRRTDREDGVSVFVLEQLGADTSTQGFNPIVVNLSTNVGLIATYMGACSFRAFSAYLKYVYKERMRTERDALPKKLRDPYKRAQLDLDIIGDRQGFEERMQRLTRIRYVEASFEEVSLTERADAFLEPMAATKVEGYTFGGTSPVERIVRGVQQYITGRQPSDVKVEGDGPDGTDNFWWSAADDAVAIARWEPSELWAEPITGHTLPELLQLQVLDRLVDLYTNDRVVQLAIRGRGNAQ